MPCSAYIVAATPRTGSSLLCEGLAATGIAGVPDEPFAPDFRAMWLERWCLDASIEASFYAEAALRHGTTANGVTAFKIQWMHVAPLAAQLGRPGTDVLGWLLPGAKFVNIVRRDCWAQAISWFRAISTNEWWRLDDAAGPPAPDLDPAAVRELAQHIEAQQAAWTAYFARRAILPLTVEYERLERDYRGELARVLSFLGLDPTAAAAVPQPRLVRQADGVSARWRRQLALAVDGSS